MNTSSLVSDCPCCGQGGLEIVRIKSSPPTSAVVCAECDRIWTAPSKVGLQNEAELDDVLSKLGLSSTWSNLERLQQGVPWDYLEAGLQLILKRRGEA
jgi:uncharacterized Zn finger protein